MSVSISRRGTLVGRPSSPTATIVKKHELACRFSFVRRFSAMTFTPTSMELVPT